MRTFNRLFIAFTLSTVLTGAAMAANKNVGTSAAQFLKIGAGARPTAMGDAFVGLADDVNAVYFNPGGLGYLTKPEITGMHSQWFQDLNYQFGAFAYPTKMGTWGISAATLKTEDLNKTGLDESNLGSFDALDAAYALSYGKMVHPLISLGGTVRFINQEIDTASAETWSGDVGALFKLGSLPLSFGLAARHFGQEVEFVDESDPLPFSVDAGLSANLYKDKLILAIDSRFPRDNDAQFGLGGEWNQPLFGEFRASGRLGYNSAVTDAGGASGMTLGGGLGYKLFELDVAWVPFGDLGNTFRYAVLIRFE